MTLASERRTSCTLRKACSTTTPRRIGPDWPRRGLTVATPREAGTPPGLRLAPRDTTFASRAWRRSQPRMQRRSGAARRRPRCGRVTGMRMRAGMWTRLGGVDASPAIVDQRRGCHLPLGVGSPRHERQRVSIPGESARRGGDGLALVLLGRFDDVGADAPGAQCIEVGRSGDRIVLAIVLVLRLDGDFLAVRAHAFVAERQAIGGGSVGARLAPRHRSTRRLAGVELPGSDYRIRRSGPGGESDRRDREEGTRGEAAEHGLQWPWPTAASAPTGPLAARSRCSTRPTVLRASRPTCSTRRAATPGEDGAEGTPGGRGPGETAGDG